MNQTAAAVQEGVTSKPDQKSDGISYHLLLRAEISDLLIYMAFALVMFYI
jgi:hypothetical protein